MSAPCFHLINVSDNANYGDLLFPIILSRIIRQRYPDAVVRNFAPTASDWSALGALRTSSYREFIRASLDETPLAIVVGGGGLFNTAWDQFLWRLSPRLQNILKHRFVKRIVSIGDGVRFFLSPLRTHLPFVLSHRGFSKARVFYNSVGAFPMDYRALDASDAEHLKSPNTFLSVRDQSVVESLVPYHVPVTLVPDSALIMSDLFDHATLSLNSREEVVKVAADAKYVVLQLGTEFAPDDLDEFVDRIGAAAARADYRIVLCPIKYRIPNRLGDAEILETVARKNPGFIYIEPQTLHETMLLIQGSAGYLGTSLHGFITAYSFGVPAFGLDVVDKLTFYIKTWLTTDSCLLGLGNAEAIFDRMAVFDPDEWANRLVEQKQLVYNNLERLLDFCTYNQLNTTA